MTVQPPKTSARFRSLLSPNLQLLDDADLLRTYAYPSDLKVPWFRANMVSSIDGSAALGGESKGLTSAPDRRLFHLMRALADVILVGAGSVRTEPYRNHRKQVIVVTRTGDLPDSFFTGKAPIIITSESLDKSRRQSLSQKSEVMAFGQTDVDFELVGKFLVERGWLRVLCEGGPALLTSLHTLGLIDEVALTIAPMLVGSGVSLLQEGHEKKRSLVLDSLLQAGDDLFARYLIEQRPRSG